jgi:hypothetical protein
LFTPPSSITPNPTSTVSTAGMVPKASVDRIKTSSQCSETYNGADGDNNVDAAGPPPAQSTHESRKSQQTVPRLSSAAIRPQTPPPSTFLDLDEVYERIERVRYERQTRYYQQGVSSAIRAHALNQPSEMTASYIAQARVDDEALHRPGVTARSDGSGVMVDSRNTFAGSIIDIGYRGSRPGPRALV